MNVLNKMVLIPEKEYQILRNNEIKVDLSEPAEQEKQSSIDKTVLKDYQDSLSKAIKNFKKNKVIRKSIKKEKSQPVPSTNIKWSDIKIF